MLSDLDGYFPLDLGERPGWFTQARIRLLAAQPEVCRRVLRRSGFRPVAIPPVRPADRACGFDDGVALSEGNLSGTPPMACATAAAYGAWVRHVVEPAAERRLGARLTKLRNMGTYACRDIAGRPGRRSQHARANAIDVSGFELSDGRLVTVTGGWSDPGARGRFLREVRDGACGLFAGVLSPDANAAHRDHLHLDLGRLDYCR